MPPAAVALVLLAAGLHAGWNYLAKSAKNTVAFLWWALLFGTAGYGVYIFLNAPVYLPRQVWLLYACSIAAEIGYLITLVRGYQHGDFSLVYPLARGSAPILVTIWGALFLSERLPAAGYLGIFLMVSGIYVVSLESHARLFPLPLSSAALWALASGFFVSVYSVLDKVIVNSVPPLVYNFWVYAGIVVVWTPFVWLASRSAWEPNVRELEQNLLRIVIGSVMTVGAYVAVLIALTMSSASYVVAGRGTSVVIGALLGWLALRESLGWVRVIGALLMVAGLALIAFS